VLEALAGAIAGMMTPQDGMQDARDVFLALNSRLAALTGGTQATPPESVPAEAADQDATGPQAAEAADPAATGPQEASPDLSGSAPAPVVPPPDGSADAQGEAAATSAGSDQPVAPPVAPPSSDPALNDAGANTTQAPHDRNAGPRQSPRRAARLAGRAEPGAPCHATCTGPPHGGPAIPDSGCVTAIGAILHARSLRRGHGARRTPGAGQRVRHPHYAAGRLILTTMGLDPAMTGGGRAMTGQPATATDRRRQTRVGHRPWPPRATHA
jgi:hypothetical protein